MGPLPASGMGCALQNAVKGEWSFLASWIYLGSLDHLELCWVGFACGSGRCEECVCFR